MATGLKGAPKCKMCKLIHFGVCGPAGDTRGLASVPANEFEITRDVIRRGKRTFIEVGEALMKMNTKKLYKFGGYDTFADFCDAEGLSRFYANRLMAGAAVSKMLPVGNKPTNEAQARELVKAERQLGPEAVAEVMQEVGSEPTAAKIRKAVQDRRQPALEPTYEIEQRCGHIYVCSKCGAPLAKEPEA